MATRLTSEILDAMLAFLVSHPEGATANTVAAVLPGTPDARAVQRWLDDLVDAGRIAGDTTTRPTLYTACKEETPGKGKAETPEPKQEETTVSPVSSFGAETSSFPEMFELAVPTILMSAMNRGSVTILLQHHAARNALTGAVAKDYVRYGHEQLAKLTVEQAVGYGLTADTYLRWRKFYDVPAANTTPTAATAPTTALSLAAEASAPPHQDPVGGVLARNDSARTGNYSSETGDTMLQAVAMTQPAPSPTPVTAPSPVPGPALAFTPAATLGHSSWPMLDLVQSVTGLSATTVLEWCAQVSKELVTIERAVMAGVWAAVITQETQKLATLGAALMFVMIPLAGLPWLYFRWRSQKTKGTAARATDPRSDRATDRPLDRSTILLLTMGGIFSLVCSVPFVWILTIVRGFVH